MIPKLSRKHRLMLTIAISLSFFVAELIAGFYTHSLALVADAFHYLSDLIGFVVALVALMVSERSQPPPRAFTFGWQRATLLGAFFNGVFLLALGVSILVQAIERFINVHEIEKPKLVLIVGCVGLGLNVLVLSFLHEHDHDHDHGHDDGHHHNHSHVHTHSESYGHTDSLNTENTGLHRSDKSPIDIESRTTSVSSSHREHRHSVSSRAKAGRDLGMLGVLIHVAGDAINNIGVIASAVIIWKAEGEGRYYADPAIGVFIAVMVFLTAVPLVRKSGTILLQIAPDGVDLDDVKKDIESIPGVESIHELHIWRLDQHKSVASAHVVVDSTTVDSFTDKAKIIMECLHAYGIHSVTLQPELDSYTHYSALSALPAQPMTERDAGIRRQVEERGCQLVCGGECGEMRCCTPPGEKV